MNDPRGPLRTITEIVEDGDSYIITLDCGHERLRKMVFSYRVGEQQHCLPCHDECRV